MSSLAATRADGYYYPPGWRPEMGSLNKMQGSHGALGKRAAKLHEGILVVRFEMPQHVWCLHCESHIAQGVRFNAEKKRIGWHHSTSIYEFRMRCPTCSGELVVETDPANRGYKYAEGLRLQTTSFSAESSGGMELLTVDERAARDADPMAKLEHAELSARRARLDDERLADLVSLRTGRSETERALNRSARRVNTQAREAVRVSRAVDSRLGFHLLPPSEEDDRAAAAAAAAAAVAAAASSSLRSPTDLRRLSMRRAMSKPLAIEGTERLAQPSSSPSLSRVSRHSSSSSSSSSSTLLRSVLDRQPPVVASSGVCLVARRLPRGTSSSSSSSSSSAVANPALRVPPRKRERSEDEHSSKDVAPPRLPAVSLVGSHYASSDDDGDDDR